MWKTILKKILVSFKIEKKYLPEYQTKKVGVGNKSVFYFCVVKPSIRSNVMNKEAGKTKI
jgi:hypothetical protein